MSIDLLKIKLDSFIMEYIHIFEAKQDMFFEYWAGDDVGAVACFGDLYYDFQDIRYDLENEIEKDLIIEWHDYTLNQHYKDPDAPIINYKNWISLNRKPIEAKT